MKQIMRILLGGMFSGFALLHLIMGAKLVMVGGSPYYLVSGLILGVILYFLWRRRLAAFWLASAWLTATLVWALGESGFNPWALLPRLWPAVLLWVPTVVLAARAPGAKGDRRGLPLVRASSAVLAVVFAGIAVYSSAAYVGVGRSDVARYDPASEDGLAVEAGQDWSDYGGTGEGRRHSELRQISPENVDRLRVAWTYSFGEDEPYGLQVTPIKVGDTLYACSSSNIVVALDAETGEERWRFDPEADLSELPFRACRGVTYYSVADSTGHCAQRVFTATVDARLIALDAATGRKCTDFGRSGEISTLEGLGEVLKGYYYHNAAPLVARGKVILGSTITDNQYWGQPSGVIRAFDARTGELAWAFDAGAPERRGAPGPGETYTPATPNAWAQMAYDDRLGLIYAPTGNATPDFFGKQRREFDEKISSAVIALDVETGRLRWVFQTTHHDVWDYDVASQPSLIDLPTPEGLIPALLQPTKRGAMFVLNRETGEPVYPVQEKDVPLAGAVSEEALSPTQPFQEKMASLEGEPLREAMMWGLTPFDHISCRIRFREARYAGLFTPPGEAVSIQYPGYFGGMNWGSATVDSLRQLAVVITNHLAITVQLVPRTDKRAEGAYALGRGRTVAEAFSGVIAQEGTPYGVKLTPFTSSWGVPCQQPPWSRLQAVSLATGDVLWQQPLGTGKDMGPFGQRSRLPLTVGVPALGGAITTASGLTFVGASVDRTFRAFETATGRLLWQAPLPESGNATPMTYLGSNTGLQYVLIAAAGHKMLGTRSADAIVAFSLPSAVAERD